MAIPDSDYEGPAIKALGSLFKITQVFLWDDGSQVPLPLECSKPVEADGYDNDDSSNLVPDWSDLLGPGGLELSKQMSELGPPPSFHTTKKIGPDICVDLRIPPASDAVVSAGSHLTGPGINYGGIEHVQSLIGTECSEISPLLCKETECETICNDDGTVTWQPHANESESVPMRMEGIGCHQTEVSNKCGVFGYLLAFWDTLRKYLFNIKTQTSTWDPPPGMEHLAIGGSIESDDGALKAAEECRTQNSTKLTKAPDETLLEEELEGKQHDEYSANAYLERSSCNDGVPCCSVANTLEHTISSIERGIQAASDANHKRLENMATDMSGLDSEPGPSMSKKDKKVRKREQQRKKLYIETEGLQFPEFAAIEKYWYQRYILFSRFDDGVKMDKEGWFSVTPEAVARYQAERCASGIIIDCFAGVGGNAIQFAKRCRHVIAIDIDPLKINYARHNAAIYGVDDQIDFIMADFFHLAPKLKADTVFLSPPWGGPDYAKVTTYDMKTMLRPRDGYTLFNVAKEIASRVVMFLPKNVNFNQLAELSLSACPPWSLEVEKVHLNGRLKAVTAYFSDTAVGGCSAKHNRFS